MNNAGNSSQKKEGKKQILQEIKSRIAGFFQKLHEKMTKTLWWGVIFLLCGMVLLFSCPLFSEINVPLGLVVEFIGFGFILSALIAVAGLMLKVEGLTILHYVALSYLDLVLGYIAFQFYLFLFQVWKPDIALLIVLNIVPWVLLVAGIRYWHKKPIIP